jgi:hypothetical protein
MARKLNDARLGSKARRDRRSDSIRAEDRRELDDQERLNEFRMSMYTSILPNLPKIKGYHVIWLTTKHQSDTIPARMRMGYEPIKPSEVPGFESLSLKTGEYAGMIGVNEMLAFKLPLHLFQMYMKEAHHDAPIQEEEKLSEAYNAVEDQMRAGAHGRAGRRIKVEREEGVEDIIQDLPAPKFRKLYGER